VGAASNGENRAPAPALVVLGGLLAGALTATGLVLLVPATRRGRPAVRAPGAPPAAATAGRELPPAVHGRKDLKAFGLPAYPGAHSFHSMEVDAGSASVAFQARGAAAGRIVEFYIRELGTRGWVFQWKRPAVETPAGAGGTRLPGYRARWLDAAGKRRLTLLAVDGPRQGQSQAVLSWAPEPAAGGGDAGSSRPR